MSQVKDPGTTRTDIPEEDREKIWQAIDQGDPIAEIAMIYCYTGMRSAELLQVKKANVDLKSRVIVAGLKTAAGQDRHIPIHPYGRRQIRRSHHRLYQTQIQSSHR